ncbi:MAG: hypothetical protein EBT02_01895 [Planctomycetia bacterium]|nr:hypothetical protein [Planctomycetia bacterium]
MTRIFAWEAPLFWVVQVFPQSLVARMVPNSPAVQPFCLSMKKIVFRVALLLVLMISHFLPESVL